MSRHLDTLIDLVEGRGLPRSIADKRANDALNQLEFKGKMSPQELKRVYNVIMKQLVSGRLTGCRLISLQQMKQLFPELAKR